MRDLALVPIWHVWGVEGSLRQPQQVCVMFPSTWHSGKTAVLSMSGSRCSRVWTYCVLPHSVNPSSLLSSTKGEGAEIPIQRKRPRHLNRPHLTMTRYSVKIIFRRLLSHRLSRS